MQAVHNEDSKFILQVLSFIRTDLGEVILSPFSMMASSTERKGIINFTMVELGKALLDTRMGWVLRKMFVSREEPLSAEEIISRMSGDVPSQGTKIPDNFMELFKFLPQVPMEHMLKMLGYDDICRLQRVSGPFAEYFAGNGRRNYAMNHLVHGDVMLSGTEKVSIIRYNNRLDISHDQLVKSLRTTRIARMMIAQEGTLRAASFHIPELTCMKLDIRVIHAINEEEEEELAEVFVQVTANLHITHLTLIARKNENWGALSNRLVEIAARSPSLIREETVICVIPP